MVKKLEKSTKALLVEDTHVQIIKEVYDVELSLSWAVFSEEECPRFFQQNCRRVDILIKPFFETFVYLVDYFHVSISKLVNESADNHSSQLCMFC